MSILCTLTWFLNGSSKHENIMKNIRKQEMTKNWISICFTMIKIDYFNVQKRQCLPKILESRWTSRIDSLSWLIKHYGAFMNILDELQNRTNERN